MHRHVLLLLALTATFAVEAHLAPDAPATLGQHLTEVNAEWPAMCPSVLNDPRTIRFTSEADRIAEHLHRVQAALSTHTPAGLSGAATAERVSLLRALQAYADRGVFPVNDQVAGRTPIFIDDLGTACAVGQLMIASGYADLAYRIHDEMNLAYVHGMHRTDVDQWAADHGFTADELAWIQPTYEFRQALEPQVLASLTLENGDVLVVERPPLSEAGMKMRVIRRSAASETVLGTLPLLSSACAVEFGGHLYVGGTPLGKAATDLYVWNGKRWSPHTVFKRASGERGIRSLQVLDGTLRAFGPSQADGRPAEVQLSTDGAWVLVER